MLFKDNRSRTGGRAASRLTIHAGVVDADTRWPGCLESSMPECWTAGGTCHGHFQKHRNMSFSLKVFGRQNWSYDWNRWTFLFEEFSESLRYHVRQRSMTENSHSMRCDSCDWVGSLLPLPQYVSYNPLIWSQLGWAVEGRVYFGILVSEQSKFVSMLGILGRKRTIGHTFMGPLVRLQFSCLLLVLEPYVSAMTRDWCSLSSFAAV